MKIDLRRIDWPVTIFLITVPILALILSPIYYFFGESWAAITLFSLIFAGLTNLSITAGYHRLFAHKSYEAHPIARAFFLLVGASAWQASALKWSSDHRRHHTYEDTDNDPYSINKGFWYAHMGWLFLKDSTDRNPKLPDLEKDWMIRFQHKYYIPLAILMGFGLPTVVGAFLGSAWGGFIIGGCLRIALTQQSTFFVNSLCHTFGRQTYSKDLTAKDSIWVAFLTHGEGYHNFHHQFQIDYRNGIRWYHWDPTKWTIRMLALMGLAKKLRKISEREILKAQLQMESLKLKSKGLSEETLHKLQEKILSAQAAWAHLKKEYQQLKISMDTSSREKMQQLKTEMAQHKQELRLAMQEWKNYLRTPLRAPITHTLTATLLAFLMVAGIPQRTHAADGSTGSGRFDFREKAKSKEGSRWTLSEWLEQKERNKMMDLWLAMYAPSPYEFYISGNYWTYESEDSAVVNSYGKHSTIAGRLGAYATIVGVELEYNNNNEEKYNDQSGALGIRIAGNAVQGTHLILQAGLRTRYDSSSGSTERLNQTFAGADLDLYITRYFGLHGNYRHFFPATQGATTDIKASRSEAGLFIDFAAVRLFGNLTTENTATRERRGVSSGLTFYF